MLSREQVANVIRDRDTYYDGMLRNGWVLPAKKQSICTLDFMQRVRAHEIYCPRVEHIKQPAVCLTPPPKHILIEKIMNAAGKREEKGEDISSLEVMLDLLLNKKKSADVPFLVQVLHLVDSEDEIFARDYVYRRPVKAKTVATMPLMNNADGFYDNLPQLRGSNSKHGQQQLRLTKAQRRLMQIKVLEARAFEITAKLNALRYG